jgi:hypothetical protein
MCLECEIAVVQTQEKISELGDDVICCFEEINKRIREGFEDTVQIYENREAKYRRYKHYRWLAKREEEFLPGMDKIIEFGKMDKSYSDVDENKPIPPKLQKIMDLYRILRSSFFDIVVKEMNYSTSEIPSEIGYAWQVVREVYYLSDKTSLIFKHLPTMDFSKSEINRMLNKLKEAYRLSFITRNTQGAVLPLVLEKVEGFDLEGYKHMSLFKSGDIKKILGGKSQNNPNTKHKERKQTPDGKNHEEYLIVIDSCRMLIESLKRYNTALTELPDVYESLEKKDETLLRLRASLNEIEEIVQKSEFSGRKGDIFSFQRFLSPEEEKEQLKKFLTKKPYFR